MTPTTFLKCFNKGERWKYAGKEVCLNQVWNSQPVFILEFEQERQIVATYAHLTPNCYGKIQL